MATAARIAGGPETVASPYARPAPGQCSVGSDINVTGRLRPATVDGQGLLDQSQDSISFTAIQINLINLNKTELN